jgi:pyruvate kinase
MEQRLRDHVTRKRTRIVTTIGPASESREVLLQLAEAGMNVARLNFSHGDFAEHGAKVENVRAVEAQVGKPIAVLQDLAGPEIRLGSFSSESGDMANLVEGAEFILTTRDVSCDDTISTVDYAGLPEQVKEGEVLILDDGKRALRVKSVSGTDIITEVTIGGPIKGRRCLFAPDSQLAMSALTDKDKADLEFITQYDVDYVAISFVRDASDIEELRAILAEKDRAQVKIIAKIETKAALENLEEILKATDAVMVARGDLGVELPATEVPLAQKRIIKMANEFGKPVITATQMLLSMVERPTPTRAEVSDASNAILDGTDALMLSEESALGKYPVEAVKMLTSIANTIDVDVYRGEIGKHMKNYLKQGVHPTDDIVSTSVAQMARRVDAKAIVALTETGGTARLISRFKSAAPIIAVTPSPVTYRQLALSANCYPIMIDRFTHISEVIDTINDMVKSNGLAVDGDRIVLSAGVPFGTVGGTNLAMVHTIV